MNGSHTGSGSYGLFETVAHHASVPLCVYDNPGTTDFEFSDELHEKMATLPGVLSIKIPGVPADAEAAAASTCAASCLQTLQSASAVTVRLAQA